MTEMFQLKDELIMVLRMLTQDGWLAVDLKALALLCRQSFAMAKGTIESTYHFNIARDRPQIYAPKKLRQVDSEDLSMLSHNVTHLELSESINHLLLDHIPAGITHLTLPTPYNGPVDHLPSSLTHLICGSEFNRLVDYLPQGLLHLVFGDEFNQRVDWLPASLKCLEFSSMFNQSIDHLPPHLTHLSFCWPGLFYISEFNQSLDNLPSSLVSLTLMTENLLPIEYLPPLTTIHIGDHKRLEGMHSIVSMSSPTLFNVDQCIHSLDHLHSVTHLTFCADFNEPLDHLPDSIVHLDVGENFNLPVDYLPNSIKYLHLGYRFNQPVDYLPNSIENLVLSTVFNQPIDHLPHSLNILFINLHCDQPVDHLPTPLAHLTIQSFHFNYPVNFLPPSITYLNIGLEGSNSLFSQSLDHLPCSIKQLKIESNFDSPVYHLPPSLEELTLIHYFNQPVDGLPASLKKLTLGHYFSQPLDKLPEPLSELEITRAGFDQPFTKLPPSLKCLKFDPTRPAEHLPTSLTHLFIKAPEYLEFSTYDLPISSFPPNLTLLVFGDNFNQLVHILPPALSFLYFGKKFMHKLSYYPETLKTLKFSSHYGQVLDNLPLSLQRLDTVVYPHKITPRPKNYKLYHFNRRTDNEHILPCFCNVLQRCKHTEFSDWDLNIV